MLYIGAGVCLIGPLSAPRTDVLQIAVNISSVFARRKKRAAQELCNWFITRILSPLFTCLYFMPWLKSLRRDIRVTITICYDLIMPVAIYGSMSRRYLVLALDPPFLPIDTPTTRDQLTPETNAASPQDMVHHPKYTVWSCHPLKCRRLPNIRTDGRGRDSQPERPPR